MANLVENSTSNSSNDKETVSKKLTTKHGGHGLIPTAHTDGSEKLQELYDAMTTVKDLLSEHGFSETANMVNQDNILRAEEEFIETLTEEYQDLIDSIRERVETLSTESE